MLGGLTFLGSEMDWQKRPTTRELARNMRASNRATRKMIDEHRLLFEDIAEIWATPEDTHVVLAHKKDPVWQCWWRNDSGVWIFESVHATLSEAQEAVEDHAVPSPPAGTYVVAREGSGRPIRVRCVSKEGPALISKIFTLMGYDTKIENVA